MEEAKLYQDGEYITSLHLLGNNDNFDEIYIDPSTGKMVVHAIESEYDYKKGKVVDVEKTYKNITLINFK